ncbi:MAG: hypothetical protein RLZZ244_494 [Verrucomicrobiota bacterium]
MPRSARGAVSGRAPNRMVCVMTNMSMIPQNFFPKKAGPDYEATPYLEILKEHRAHFTVCSGLSHPGVDGAHLTEKCFLSGAPHPGASHFRNTISMDQLAAERMGRETRFPSLVLLAGKRDLGLPSVSRAGVSIPPESDPVALYRKLFVQGSAAEVAERMADLRRGRSVLDFVREEASGLRREMGARDKERMEQYFTSIREMEGSLQAAEAWEKRPKPGADFREPKEGPDEVHVEEQTDLFYRLVRMALATDSTRVVSLYLGPLMITPKIAGVTTQTHGLTHHGGNAEKLDQLARIESAQFRCLERFLAGLRSTGEGGRSLLDQTQVLYGSNLGNANSHDTTNLPILLAGGGYKHGQHLMFDRVNNTPLANLFVNMLQGFGMEVSRFASSTGTLRGLEVRA